jgi:hypothetical protein
MDQFEKPLTIEGHEGTQREIDPGAFLRAPS